MQRFLLSNAGQRASSGPACENSG